MTRIDDPNDQINLVSRDESGASAPSVVFQFAAPIIAALDPRVGVLAGFLTRTWMDIFQTAKVAGISRDDWYATCGRLGGFGLLMPVRTNSAMIEPEHEVFRITGPGRRLLALLGLLPVKVQGSC